MIMTNVFKLWKDWNSQLYVPKTAFWQPILLMSLVGKSFFACELSIFTWSQEFNHGLVNTLVGCIQSYFPGSVTVYILKLTFQGENQFEIPEANSSSFLHLSPTLFCKAKTGFLSSVRRIYYVVCQISCLIKQTNNNDLMRYIIWFVRQTKVVWQDMSYNMSN